MSPLVWPPLYKYCSSLYAAYVTTAIFADMVLPPLQTLLHLWLLAVTVSLL